MNKLFTEAVTKFILGIGSSSLILFGTAGSLKYKNGWLFIAVLSFPMILTGAYLLNNDTELLEKRLRSREKEKTQRYVMLFSLLMFIAIFAVSGLNFKYKWSKLPFLYSILAAGLFIFFYLLYCVVLKENPFLSRTVEVKENQKLIDTGLYAVVRHPMYMVTVFMFCLMPLILGSLQAFLISLFYPLILVKRIENEEEVLERELSGYKEYKKRVKYRLFPHIY